MTTEGSNVMSEHTPDSLVQAGGVQGDPYTIRATSSPFDVIPRTVYFYYINPASREVKHYVFISTTADITKAVLNDLIKNFVDNARGTPNPRLPLPQYGADWQYVVWMHKSYFVAFVDDPTYRPIPGGAFEVTQPAMNFSFSDAWEEPVTLPHLSTGQLTQFKAICCINHMKGDFGGSDLGSVMQHVDFELNTTPTLPNHVPPHCAADLAYPGTGGTNMGPPVPPPIYGPATLVTE
jgi:hypothetical protein